MRINKDNKQGRIIGTDDIFVSSNNSSLGNDLGSILLKQDQDILDLKKNVKWLYKYGGVGGNGGGSSASATKINCVLSYTDFNGNKVQSKIENNSVFNIKEGTPISVTCTIISTKSLNEYTFSLNNLKTTIKATDVNGVLTTSPESNQIYTITVIGETTVSLSFQVFTLIIELTHRIKTGNILILPDNSIYESLLDNANYVFILKNYQPDNFESSIDEIFINLKQINSSDYKIDIIEDKTVNTKTITLTIPLKNLFTTYDIYNIQVNYTFGSEDLSLTDTFIYQSKEAFIYCWSDTVSVYKEETNNPNISNNYNNLIKYRVYPKEGDSITTKYNVNIQTDEEEASTIIQSGLQGTYIIVNKVKDSSVLAIKIKFTLDNSVSYTYYIYLSKSEDVEYFFKKENGDYYYGAIVCDTENLNNNIIGFPKKDASTEDNAIKISSDISFELLKTQEYYNSIPTDNSVNSYILSELTSSGKPYCDALFSFGLKYGGSDFDLKILTIHYNSLQLIIYKNKIDYGGTTYDICIPNDDKYHLIQLYFKSSYKIDGNEWKLDFSSSSQVVALYIDGVQETKPISISNFYIEPYKDKTITYHSGLWQFNHIGLAIFNGHTTTITENDVSNISKYLFDFDPIIPSNYYLTYKTKVLKETLSELFDKTIYSDLSNSSSNLYSRTQWINFFGYKDNEVSKHLNKFISISPSVIAKLAPSNMEMYCIVPESTHLTLLESGLNESPSYINLFLYNTMISYGENDKISSVSCNFQKWKSNSFKDIISNNEGDVIQFYVKYQGSSTLLYTCKNFEVGIKPILNQDGYETPVYFTPDVDLFPYMELCFNLKADVVDSSHSNNVVIGNFVNDYMESPFNTTSKTYKSCLTGKPILLFMQNNAIDQNDKGTSLDDSYIFLGIYSLNLNRSSVHNLGYSYLLDSNGKEIITTSNEITDERCIDSKTKFHILQTTEKEVSNNNFAVAEVLDNGILFDYSQFDDTLLANQILGDFFVSDNKNITRTYSKVFSKPFKALASIINKYILEKDIFNKVNWTEKFKDYNVASPSKEYYYTNSSGVITQVEENSIIIPSDVLNGLTEDVPYHTKDENDIVYINDPLLQFHLICNKSGIPIIDSNNNYYYYLEKLNNLPDYESEAINCKIDVEASVKYFVTCMAFAMVDSVQKNLTFKCPNTNNDATNIWYPAFYDMDTAFGISNSGGSTSFQAFSDYVENGTIIQDYSPLISSGYFDTPSSFLFLYAKYIDILTVSRMSDTTDGIYPYLEWSLLRSKNGKFESGSKFCEKYIDNYFGTINPLLWNLNYAYKYFSQSNNRLNDNESSRFNGTRRFARKEYLNNRFRYLDVLFGFKNNKKIGKSLNDFITYGNKVSIPDNDDIKITGTMFPDFTKGVNGIINSKIKEEPNTPIVLQITTNNSKLYITDSSGEATVSGSVTSNTDTGFFGTQELKEVDDCGKFLINEDNNTIKNNKIKEIKINKSDLKITPSITINLDDVESVKNITISPSKTTKYGTIIINGNNSKSYQLSNITIKNVKCSSLQLRNFSVDILDINNITCNDINISSVTINKNFKTNSLHITNYSISLLNGVSDISIYDENCVTLKLENITNSSISFTSSKIQTLKLDKITTNEFKLGVSYVLKSITVTGSSCSKFILSNKFTINKNIDIPITELNLGFTNKEISLAIPGLNKLETFTLGAVTTCRLMDNAFNECTSLTSLPEKSSDETTIKYIINGKNVFRKTNSLNQKLMLNCSLEGNYDGIFMYNENIDSSFVINWFKTHKPYSLNRLFCGCKNIKMFYQISETNLKGSIPSKYKEFETAFVDSITNNGLYPGVTSIEGLFYFANVNILTKKITDILVEKGIKTINSLLGYYTGETTRGSNFQFIERLALNDFENVTLNGLQIEGVDWNYPNCVIIDSNGHYVTNSKMSDYFNEECKISTLLNFTPFTSLNYNNYQVIFDFGKDGFPKSLKNVKMFVIASGMYVKNMENAFNNVSGCTLEYDSFYNTICLADDAYRTDLFEMFFTETNDGIKPKVDFAIKGSADNDYYLSFPKKITYENFKKVMNYFINLSKTNNENSKLNFFFRGTKITDCDNDHIFDYLLPYFTDLVHTFAYCEFYKTNGTSIYMDLSNAFKEDENTEYISTVKNLRSTFEGCKLKKFKTKLPLVNVTYMLETFKNCKFSYTVSSSSIGTYSNTNLYSIPVYLSDDFKLLPDDFFLIGDSGCVFTNCFACDSFNIENLTGFLPNENTMGLTGVNCNNIFKNCNITYYSYGNDYRMFPEWYTLLSMENKYNVYMPFPPSTQDKIVYLFENAKNNGEKISGDYGTLPSLPGKTGSGVNTDYWRILINSADNYISNTAYIKVGEGVSEFPSNMKNNFKNMIPYRLSLFMTFDSKTTVILDLDKLTNVTGPVVFDKDISLMESGKKYIFSRMGDSSTIINENVISIIYT